MAKTRSTEDLNTHKGALEYLVNHLDVIGIDRKDISWIVKEPQLYICGKIEQCKSCDIVVGYSHYGDADLIELKHSYEQMNKANIQLNNTKKYFLDEIGYNVNNKYVVFYPFFNYEILPKENN